MKASRLPVDVLMADEYVCRRCGSRRRCTPGRRPEHCGDCTYVLNYDPEKDLSHLTYDEVKEFARLYQNGVRTPETLAGKREYNRRRDQLRHARNRERNTQ